MATSSASVAAKEQIFYNDWQVLEGLSGNVALVLLQQIMACHTAVMPSKHINRQSISPCHRRQLRLLALVASPLELVEPANLLLDVSRGLPRSQMQMRRYVCVGTMASTCKFTNLLYSATQL
jgi:hypothetical protein